MPILEPLTTIKYAVKDLFNFTSEIVEQDSRNFMGSLDITDIPLEETIEICTKNNDIAPGLEKSEFKDLSLATKESHFIFNNILYKQITEYLWGLH